jgi:hypothetical protein
MAALAGFGKLLKDVARPALTSGALAGGLSLIGGANPLQALASGAVDVAADVVTLGALRKLSPKSYTKRTLIDKNTGEKIVQQGSHPLETPLNIAASIGAGYATSPLIYGTGQAQQIAQQVDQRALVNNLSQGQLLSPGTNFQMAGMPDPEDFQQLLNQRNNWTQYLSPQDQALVLQATRGAA